MSASEEAVWSVVMFDLPVKTKHQRTEATQFRNLLLDQGYQMAQYSVYVRFSPSYQSLRPALKTIRSLVPPGGEVRMMHVTDRQWSNAWRCVNASERPVEDAPQLLTIF